MTDKYIYNNSGQLAEKTATVSSAGVGDAGKIVALDGTGKLDSTVMPTGIGADVASITAGENLSAGDLVNIYDDSGAFKVRKADAATNKPAHGFVLSAATSGNAATVYFEGTNAQVTGLSAGYLYLSGSSPGQCAAAAPTTSGYIVQKVGVATSATSMNFEGASTILLA